MSDGFQFIDIIFLAMLAVFIALRLRSVLGRRTGHERPPSEEATERAGAPEQKTAPTAAAAGHPAGEAPAADYRFILKSSSPAFDGVDAIVRQDPSFSPESFAAGARSAYQLILEGFWQADSDAFRPFVSREIFQQFDGAIKARQAAGEQVKNTLEKVRAVEIVEAGVRDGMARVVVRFTADIITMTVDKEGRVTEGNPVDTIEVKDVWTFERQLASADPNWMLVATRSEE
ncbi:MAG: Tim44 domain-containing protein [Sphingomonadales bacterium]|nr:Tim44 domain-containing protein [Sphingomonadales bacterium]